MSEKLKPCPFCGGKVKVILTENIQVDGIFYVVTRGNTKKNYERYTETERHIADYFLKVN